VNKGERKAGDPRGGPQHIMEIPDSPGRNTGLSRKKYRTLQEEIPDSPGRNAGLSRKKCRTLQEMRSRVFLQT
jgi:hypothetical protein